MIILVLLYGVPIIGLLYLFFKYMQMKQIFLIELAKINREQGLNFSMDVMLGEVTAGMLIDREHRKLLISDGKNADVKDFGYVTRWSLHWRERQNGVTDKAHILVDTNDFDRPQLKFRVPNVAAGNAWTARLDIIFNQENKYT